MNFQEIGGRLGRLLTPGLLSELIVLDSVSKKLAFEIQPNNFGRAIVLTEFVREISEVFTPGSTIRVAVVGGYPSEPELRALSRLGYQAEVTIFGIESNMKYLNLNALSETSAGDKFDLILCSQVWEHIWNHGNAFQNLFSLMDSGTYLWLACPASNRAHGSPDFFSAGFTSGYFAKNLDFLGLTVISSGQLGTARNYRATHTMPEWLSLKSHRIPISNTFVGSKVLKQLIFTVRYLLRNIELHFFSGKITSNESFATESWILARKI